MCFCCMKHRRTHWWSAQKHIKMKTCFRAMFICGAADNKLSHICTSGAISLKNSINQLNFQTFQFSCMLGSSCFITVCQSQMLLFILSDLQTHLSFLLSHRTTNLQQHVPHRCTVSLIQLCRLFVALWGTEVASAFNIQRMKTSFPLQLSRGAHPLINFFYQANTDRPMTLYCHTNAHFRISS